MPKNPSSFRIPSPLRWLGRQWMWLTVAGIATVFAPLAGRTNDGKGSARNLETLTEVMGLIQRNVLDPPTPKQVTHASIQGMLHTLDPHSNFMDEAEFRQMREDQRGSFFGIGVVFQQHLDGLVIVSVTQGGPSEKLGIRPGDYIREIDGKSTEGWSSSQAVHKLRGDKGTVVEVGLERAGNPELLRFSITRGEIPSNTILYAFMITPTTGFITVKDFGEATSEEFEKSVAALKRQGMRELVLDLRNNTGGLVDAATGICRQLLGPNELIVSQRGRDGRDTIETRTPKTAVLDPYPVVVLINRVSASASEIVAGAIQDHDRGIVVGTTSWGKGLVQSVLAIGRSKGLALTTARYYTPSGRCIQRDYHSALDDYLNPEDAKKPAEPKGPTYQTDLGRTVYGGGGITPDHLVDTSRVGTFAANLRYRHSAFFKFAVLEREAHGVRPAQPVDDAVLARFKDWMKEQKIPFTDAEWEASLKDFRDQIAIEMLNLAFGLEAGFRYVCDQDPQVKKALEVLPEAEALLQRKLTGGNPPPAPAAP